jgi:glutamine amidotransferase
LIKICILDYGLGNIKSLSNALKKIGFKCEYYSDKKKKNYDLIFLPGVGSFQLATKYIKEKKIDIFIKKSLENETKLFGICLGMQLLFKKGYENGVSKGLHYFDGEVKKIKGTKILPIVGWKKTYFDDKNFSIFKNSKFYYCHSYEAKFVKKKYILSIALNQNKSKYVSSVFNNNIIATQFHPEKSGEVGLNFLDYSIKKLVK